MSLADALVHISNHILSMLSTNKTSSPLFVALQGPQGSGKTYLSERVRSHLSAAPYALSVVVLSIDDLYLTHEELVSLAQRHPENPLWRGRGQPGTHDVELGLSVLKSVKDRTERTELPRFDKSLFDGEGDRIPTGTILEVDAPVDVFIMEGWFTGFYPISSQELDTRWDGVWAREKEILHLEDSVVGTKENIIAVNEALVQYMELWSFFDLFIKLEATAVSSSDSSLSTIYTWRTQQEHHMKLHNGGKGMSDAAVKLFVDRYMPGYVFFGDGVFKGYESVVPRWLGRSLRISLDQNRDVIAVQPF